MEFVFYSFELWTFLYYVSEQKRYFLFSNIIFYTCYQMGQSKIYLMLALSNNIIRIKPRSQIKIKFPFTLVRGWNWWIVLLINSKLMYKELPYSHLIYPFRVVEILINQIYFCHFIHKTSHMTLARSSFFRNISSNLRIIAGRAF